MSDHSIDNITGLRSTSVNRLIKAMNTITAPLFADEQPSSDGRVRWSIRALILTHTIMAWESSSTIVERFHRARELVGSNTGGTYQGFMKALRRNANILSEHVMPKLRAAVRRTAGGQWWKRCGFVAMTVDGTKHDAPRTTANEEVLGPGEKTSLTRR